MTAPRNFSTYTKDAGYFVLQAERALSLAADAAPSPDLAEFTSGQARNLKQLRRVLPAVRDKARRS